jgi:hypothetical protein
MTEPIDDLFDFTDRATRRRTLLASSDIGRMSGRRDGYVGRVAK